ncbi:hypothetical protein ACFGVR_15330 [Mucilaginibacter sp. AW1-3]
MMMRLSLLAIFLLGSLGIAHAQTDYCADLVRDTDKVTKVITCTGPDMSMALKAVINGRDTTVTINFNIKELVSSDEAGLYIKLDDGHTLRYFGQKINKIWLNSRDGYNYETVLTCSPAVLRQFKAQKIKVFQIAGIDVTVHRAVAEEFQGYLNCMVK